MPRIEVGSGDGPATHALVVGVSRYRHVEGGAAPTELGESFGLEPLTAAARSAGAFAKWLLEEYHCPEAPLRSLRVSLSPVEGEAIDEVVGAHLAPDPSAWAATRAIVQADLKGFERDCASHEDNVAIVYVAGHGVQLSKHGAIVLLEDFAAPEHLNELEGAIDVAGCHAGMNHAATAGTQFWFVDACRQRPAVAQRFETLEGALTLSQRRGAARVTSPLVLASSTREAAFARVLDRTLFCDALLWALTGAAATGPDHLDDRSWHVSVMNLLSKVDGRVSALARGFAEEQNVDPTGRVRDAVVQRFERTPLVDLRVDLSPAEAGAAARARLLATGGRALDSDGTAWPLRWKVEAGLYVLEVEVPPPFRRHTEPLMLAPPEKVHDVRLSG